MPGYEHLVGHRFPDGEVTVTAAEDDRLRRAVEAPPRTGAGAHPSFCHIATHTGKGVTFTELAELVGSSFDAGFLFGNGSFVFHEPVRVDRPYAVRGGITGVESRLGRRTGPFDLITTELDLVDRETGAVVCTSSETYVCPR